MDYSITSDYHSVSFLLFLSSPMTQKHAFLSPGLGCSQQALSDRPFSAAPGP